MNAEQDMDRRRHPRWPLSHVRCRLELRTRVRLVDISGTGALLATDVAVPVGTAGHLRAGIGPAFAPAIEVMRQMSTGQRPSLAMGTIFTSMDDQSRQSLEEFLKKANV